MRRLLSVPELTFLVLLVIVSYVIMGLFSKVESTEVLSSSFIFAIIVGSFLISTFIAVVAVVAGVGGGVIFTPIMLGFTSIDTMIVRATGLVVAMFSGLISSGPFMRKGLAECKLVYYCAIPIIVGAIAGALSAVYLSEVIGEKGDAIVRLLLGLALVFIAFLFIFGGSKTEYPKVKHVDAFTKRLGIAGSYWEEALSRTVNFDVTRALHGAVLFIFVGFAGGFFGLGGGWAVVPVLNLVMMAPLKIAAASSGVLLAIGNAAAIWPYIIYGALIPLFVAPWMLGQVVGGILGAYVLARIRAAFVRKVLLVIIFLTSFKLVVRGIEGLVGIDIPVI
ncbi:MAG: sulfite exporter TauE/SafE family protein [Deltaproteobacteria bacterium]|nr:sulfite exporter TauE/SafE family protein [Deltaproteobacteria bacterium]MBW2137890.1 sulfite exporter TauE/SafE family protein [Deltaproteobacteria bacterium]